MELCPLGDSQLYSQSFMVSSLSTEEPGKGRELSFEDVCEREGTTRLAGGFRTCCWHVGLEAVDGLFDVYFIKSWEAKFWCMLWLLTLCGCSHRQLKGLHWMRSRLGHLLNDWQTFQKTWTWRVGKHAIDPMFKKKQTSYAFHVGKQTYKTEDFEFIMRFTALASVRGRWVRDGSCGKLWETCSMRVTWVEKNYICTSTNPGEYFSSPSVK